MDYKLDEATRKSLIGLMPMTQGGTLEFTPEIFAGLNENARPVFIQRAFTRGEKSEIAAMDEQRQAATAPFFKKDEKGNFVASSDSTEHAAAYNAAVRPFEVKQIEYARKTVKGWKSVYDPSKGDPINFKADPEDGADKDLFDGFCEAAKMQLYMNAKKISSLLPQERVALKS